MREYTHTHQHNGCTSKLEESDCKTMESKFRESPANEWNNKPTNEQTNEWTREKKIKEMHQHTKWYGYFNRFVDRVNSNVSKDDNLVNRRIKSEEERLSENIVIAHCKTKKHRCHQHTHTHHMIRLICWMIEEFPFSHRIEIDRKLRRIVRYTWPFPFTNTLLHFCTVWGSMILFILHCPMRECAFFSLSIVCGSLLNLVWVATARVSVSQPSIL